MLKKVKSLISIYQWAPEEISYRLTLESSLLPVSFSCHAGMLVTPLTDRYGKGGIKKLRHHEKKRHLKGEKERRGHFEADTIVGKKQSLPGNSDRQKESPSSKQQV